jgi:hypothetical protein
MIKTMKMFACLAWIAAAVSSAAPVEAFAVTMQSGYYAACSANYTPQPYTQCLELNYTQTIKFIASSCSSGSCSQDAASVRTDIVYPQGRKVTAWDSLCSGSVNVWELDSCAC